jgi:hypothetical protein
VSWRGIHLRQLALGLIARCDGCLFLECGLARAANHPAQPATPANWRNVFANIVQHPR